MKKIAIITKKMDCGGTEVSLLNLLNKIHKKYEITLYLMQKKGMYLKDIPSNIKIIEIFDDDNAKLFEPMKEHSGLSFIMFLKKVFVKFVRKFSLVEYYKVINKLAYKTDEYYDYCIDFHGYGFFGSYYALNSIRACKKITFVHDENIHWIKPIVKIYDKFDYYFCVSNSCIDILEESYKFTVDKTKLCRNVLDIKKIAEQSNEIIDLEFDKSDECAILLTIGRLEYQKGYDLLINVARILVNNKINYKWYIIGDGSLYSDIKNDIRSNNLENNVFLLGKKKNPYPYIKNCDIYVQTSRHEGYGIAIAEARILNRPIITTDLNCIKEQIKDNENGILSKYDAKIFSSKLQKLIIDKEMQLKLIDNLKKNNNKDVSDFELLIK